MSSYCHRLMPGINVLNLKTKPSFDGKMYLISDPLLVLKICIINGSKSLLIPLMHREDNEIKRLNDTMRSR